MSDGKIRGAFNDEQFEAFCQELQALPAKQRTLQGIAAIFEARTGIKASHEAAKTFKTGPYDRYVKRINSGRETREALCAAAGSGVHPLDAIEEAMVIELQDSLIGADEGQVDIKFIIGQLSKLRLSISMREESHRKQLDLERKQKETEAKLSLAEQQMKLRDEQIAVLRREREQWEKQQREIAEQLSLARNATGKKADEVRAAAVDEIDRIMGIKPAK